MIQWHRLMVSNCFRAEAKGNEAGNESGYLVFRRRRCRKSNVIVMSESIDDEGVQGQNTVFLKCLSSRIRKEKNLVIRTKDADYQILIASLRRCV